MRALGLRVSEKNFEGCLYVPLFTNVIPGDGPVLTQGASYTNLVEVYKEMGFFVPMFQLVTLGAEPILTPGIICIKLVEVQKEILYTKYQSSMPSSFREES